MVKIISKPHATWKPKLNDEERESTWAKAAGDGKSPIQHETARERFTRKANEAAAEAKKGIGLTKEEDTILKRKQVRQSNDKSAKGILRENPENREKNNAAQRARLEKPETREQAYAATRACKKAKTDALQADRAADFEAKGVGVTTEFGLGYVSRADELECGA